MILMPYNFDELIDRRTTESVKWNRFDEDVLPAWVADMDFRSPEPVIAALQERVSHGVFGYGGPPKALPDVICSRLKRLYDWTVTPDELIFLPSVVTAFNTVCRGVVQSGEAVLIQPPVYPPFHTAPANHGQILQTADLALIQQGQQIRYEVDFDQFEAAITPETKLFLLCHPHNPTGVSYRPETLTRLAEICERHNLIICSDEIHGDLLLDGTPHKPTATLSPDIAARCITLMAPSKTYNVPGLSCSFAIVQNPELKKQLERAGAGIVPGNNILGTTAALAAYQHGDEWLNELLIYLTKNRDTVSDYIQTNMPTLRYTVPETTYLTWLDCRESGIEGNPQAFFKDKAKVALNDGAAFGKAGEGFVRFNFAAPRSRVLEALERMSQALQTL